MQKTVVYIYCLALLALTGGCIRETMPECPSEYTVWVTVGDKNYENITEIPFLSSKDETLPFREFAGTVHYSLQRLENGETLEESGVETVGHTMPQHAISINNLSKGKYLLTVWGNSTKDIPTTYLHKDGQEHTDIYLATDTLNVTSGKQSKTVVMHRAKGKLLLICNNFPEEITGVKQEVTSLYEKVDKQFNYSGNTKVNKTFARSPQAETVLAPTLAGGTSMLNLQLLSLNNNFHLPVFPPFEIQLKRNHITMIAINYKPTEHIWEICLYIDDKWQVIHYLDLSEDINASN